MDGTPDTPTPSRRRPAIIAAVVTAIVLTLTLGTVTVLYLTAPRITSTQAANTAQLLSNATGWTVNTVTLSECNTLTRIRTGDWITYPNSEGCQSNYSAATITFTPTNTSDLSTINHLLDVTREHPNLTFTGPDTLTAYGEYVTATGTITLSGSNPLPITCASGTSTYTGRELFCTVHTY